MTDTNPGLPSLDTGPMSTARPRSALRVWTVRGIKLALLGVVLYFVGRALVHQLRDVRASDLRFRFGWLGLAGLCLLLAGCIGVAIRRLLLAGFCEPPSWRSMATISWVPLVGKYIPGKVFSVAGTIWMLKRHGVRDTVAVSLLLIVNALSMVLGLLIALPLTFWRPVVQKFPQAWLAGLALMVGFAVCLHPRVFGALCNEILRRFKRPPLVMVPRVRNYVEPLLLMGVNWILTGLALWLISRSLTDVGVAQVPIFVATAAMAVTAGLLAFFAPAGLGVREAFQLVILNELMPGPQAALTVVAMRLIQTLTEVVLISTGWALRERGEMQADPES